jgi:hypothetical protein
MDKNEIINDVRDILIRIEGTINILHKPDVLQADRKLQGIRDKARHLLSKLIEEGKSKDDLLVKKIKSATDNETH